MNNYSYNYNDIPILGEDSDESPEVELPEGILKVQGSFTDINCPE
jgi:hypothetical protein